MKNITIHKLIYFFCCLIAVISVFHDPAYGQEIQSLASIKATAQDFILSQNIDQEAKITVTARNLDARLRLSLCTNALETFKSPGSTRLLGNVSVGVRCNDEKPWTVYVPVLVKAFGKVLVAKHYLARGVQLKDTDVSLEERDLSILTRGYLTESQEVIGKVLKQAIRENAIISPHGLKNADLVYRGEGVIILASKGGLEVKMKGKALMDGSSGQRIRVKNLRSQRIIEATVSSRGIVKVPM